MKALFFSSLVCLCFLACGVLYSQSDIETEKSLATEKLETKASNKTEKSISNIKELKYKKLETKITDNQALEEESVIAIKNEESPKEIDASNVEELPVEESVQETNSLELIDNNVVEKEVPKEEIKEENDIEKIKQTISLFSDSLVKAQNIEEIKSNALDLENIDTSLLQETSTISNDLKEVQNGYNNILQVDDFLKKAQVLDNPNKTKDDVLSLKATLQSADIKNIVQTIPNDKLKNNYLTKLANVTKILDDETSPEVNIGDNQVLNDNVQLEITDENAYQVYLNGQLVDDLNITENGEYNLKVEDEALNETNIHFKLEKPEEEEEEIIYTEVSNDTESIPEEEKEQTRYPLNNWYMTQDYEGKNGHMGIDLGSSNKKEEIYPIADGTVVYVGQDNYGANLVQIKHNINGEELYSTYGHMSEVYFNNDQEVSQNDLLGLMGATGNATGPHLHLEMATCGFEANCSYATYKDNLVNPWDYLP